MTSSSFPKSIVVRVRPNPESGLAVRIYFDMSKKNNFGYTVFLGPDGVAHISGEQLLNFFDLTRNTFTMDYMDPRGNFTGKIKAKVLTHSDLQRTLEAFESWRENIPFPVDYEKNLIAALKRGQNAEKYQVDVAAE
jgi:hypothetical protein